MKFSDLLYLVPDWNKPKIGTLFYWLKTLRWQPQLSNSVQSKRSACYTLCYYTNPWHSIRQIQLYQGLEQLQKQFFTYTFARMYLYTGQKTSKRLFDWQILKIFFGSRGIDLYIFAIVYYFVSLVLNRSLVSLF